MLRRNLIVLLFLLATSATQAAGWVDVATYGRYAGWACQLGNENPVGIHIWRDDGVFLGGGNAPNLRERAVANACQTMNAYHGFDITLQIPQHLIDNQFHRVSIYAVFDSGNAEQLTNSPVLVEFGTYDPRRERPAALATVVGRDLNVPTLGPIGHIGVWDGEYVIEALNEGGTNKIKRSGWSDFITRNTNLWNKANPSTPTQGFTINGCFYSACIDPTNKPSSQLVFGYNKSDQLPKTAIAKRAYAIYLISGSYTLGAFPTQATPGKTWWTYDFCNPFSSSSNCPLQRSVNPLPGIYRCDTLILDVYAISALPAWGLAIEAKYPDSPGKEYTRWHKRMNTLVNGTSRWPANIYSELSY